MDGQFIALVKVGLSRAQNAIYLKLRALLVPHPLLHEGCHESAISVKFGAYQGVGKRNNTTSREALICVMIVSWCLER